MTQQEPIARRLAEWVDALDLERVPADVIRAGKRSLVDTIGVAIGGSCAPAAVQVRDHVLENYSGAAASLLGTSGRASVVGAAMANGMAAHVLDFDDTSYAGIIHGSTIIVPAVLAAAEQRSASGADLLAGFIAGSEAAYAIGLTASNSHYMKGWWATGTCGVIGATAGAARIFGCGRDATADAIGLAAVQACGMVAMLGTDAKPFLAGRSAMAGLECAAMAARGFSAPHGAMEDPRGFLALMNDGEMHDEGLSDLGTVWRLVEPGIFFKRYPVCSAAQAAGELLEQLLARHGLERDDIASVTCEVPELVAISLVHDRPETPAEAQFSMPFALASILCAGRLGPEHLSPDWLADARMQEAMGRIEMRPAADLDAPELRARYPESARITLKTRRGDTHTDFLGASTGMPETPLSDADLSEKFRSCARFAGTSDLTTDRLLAGLWALESVTDVGALMRGEGP